MKLHGKDINNLEGDELPFMESLLTAHMNRLIHENRKHFFTTIDGLSKYAIIILGGGGILNFLNVFDIELVRHSGLAGSALVFLIGSFRIIFCPGLKSYQHNSFFAKYTDIRSQLDGICAQYFRAGINTFQKEQIREELRNAKVQMAEFSKDEPKVSKKMIERMQKKTRNQYGRKKDLSIASHN